jgi:hypothetical protein
VNQNRRQIVSTDDKRAAAGVLAEVHVDALIDRYAADWGRMRRTGLSRAELLRRFLDEVGDTVRKAASK